MKNVKRLLAILLAAVMVFSVFGCSKDEKTTKEEQTTPEEVTTEEPTTEPTTEPSGDVATEITINLHYIREDGAYEGWSVWLWPAGGEGTDNPFGTEVGEHGVMASATFPAGTDSVGFIVRTADWSKDIGEDQFIDLKGILAGTVNVYVVSGVMGYTMEKGADCVSGLSVGTATLKTDYVTLEVTMTDAWTDDNKLTVKDTNGNVVEVASTVPDESNNKKLVLTLKEKADPLGSYIIVLNDTYEYAITTPDYYSTEGFESEFTYDGDDLGATWSKSSTTFKVWAPTATKVVVNLYEGGKIATKDLIKAVDMTKGDKGVWSVTVDGDLNGTYYTYSATVQGKTKEVCDPYARTTGVNGNRAMVIDLASTNPEGWDKDTNPNKGMDMTDAIIYELHVRDLSIDSSSGIKNAGKYLGLTELNTKNASGTLTGLSHMKDLGITHLHLNPVYDYATVDELKLDTPQFNWGYDPKNYNVPEGSYSTDPYNGEVRVEEFKEMVKALHDNGISVVMDVVYNHTYSTDFCFNGLVPDYFHRPGSNGSGCGNDVASERAMVRKYIVDSCVYWATEYHVDGFRFDLVGLIDVETIKEIRTELDKIDPSIILYGEGWSMSTKATKPGTVMATQSAVKQLEGFAMFNDTIRDALKGSVFNSTEKGYVNGELSKTNTIKTAITGKVTWSSTPSHMVNYSCCHDNYTLWDEISMSNPDDSLEARLHQNLLSAAVVFTSQGVPFILAGEEFLRSKPTADGGFDHNSYASPDSVNSMKWNTLDEAANKTAYNYYKGLIQFRKAHASMTQMKDAQSCYKFVENLDKGVIAYELAKADGEVSDGIFVVHNATTGDVTVNLPAGNWTICVQGEQAGTTSLGTASGSIKVSGISTTILVKGALK